MSTYRFQNSPWQHRQCNSYFFHSHSYADVSFVFIQDTFLMKRRPLGTGDVCGRVSKEIHMGQWMYRVTRTQSSDEPLLRFKQQWADSRRYFCSDTEKDMSICNGVILPVLTVYRVFRVSNNTFYYAINFEISFFLHISSIALTT